MRLPAVLVGTIALIAAATAAYEGNAMWRERQFAPVRAELTNLPFPSYAAQKVVYHVQADRGWFDGNYRDILGSMRNHVNAVGPDAISMRVVLQGPGVRLLSEARSNPKLRDQVDWLRSKGVRFLVCRNSLLNLQIDPADLYGLNAADLVPAAVAEISALESQGYVYLRL